MTETATTPESGVDDSTPVSDIDTDEQPEIDITEDAGELSETADDAIEEGEGQEEGDDEESFIDIEQDGKTYKVPAALKNAFLRNADYTRKTQALAETRRALEGEKQNLSREAELVRGNLAEFAQLKTISDQIAAYDSVDWAGLARQNPQLAQRAWAGLTQLKQLGGSLAASLQQKELTRSLGAQQEHATHVEQGRAVLARDIPGWSPDLGHKLVDFAVDAFGFAPQEVGSVMDPRVIKVLHAAYQTAQAGKNAARVKHIQAAQGTRPVTEVKAGAGTEPRDPARMSHAEYRRWRNRAQT